MNFADQRVLRNIPAVLSVTFVDQDGAPAAPAGAVTVEVVRADGTVLHAAGTVTVVGAPASVRTVALTAAQNTLLDRLTCTWTAASGEVMTSHVDVVGAYYFALADLKSLDGMTGLETAALRVARQAVEEMVERRTGWVWTPRLEVETLAASDFCYRAGWNSSAVNLVRRPVRALRSIAVDGVAEVLTDWTHDEWGRLTSRNRRPASTASAVTVAYEVGEDRPPQALIRALMDAAKQSELDHRSGVSARALSMTNEFGNINYARATAENLFGNPAVDAVLAFWDRRIPSVA